MLINRKNKELKIVFINLHGDTNMASAYLHSLVNHAGFDATTINFKRFTQYLPPPTKKELNALEKTIAKIKPNVIGISVNSMSFWNAIIITKIFKKKYNVVWGGVQPLIDPEKCMEHVDFICRGEGDEALLEFLEKLENKKSIDKIKNFWIKKKEKIIKNDFRPLVQNLNELPFPDFSDNKKLHIMGGKIFKKNPLPHIKYEYNITFSRGCPFNCSYCINHFYNKTFKGKYLRKRSIKNVLEELKLAVKKNPKIKFIRFWDDVFIADVKWVKEFCKEYKKHIGIPFFAYGNANLINEENIKALKYAGMKYFDVGIQSGCKEIRNDVFKRTDTNEKILRASKIIKKIGVEISYDIIFSEFETEVSVKEGLEFLFQLPKPFNIHSNQLAYYPNFDVTKRALNEGKITLGNVASINPKIRSQVPSNETIEKNNMQNYFLLLGNRLIPNKVIKYMFENKFHKKYPALIKNLGKISFNFEEKSNVSKNMVKMFFRGEWGYLKYRIFSKGDLF